MTDSMENAERLDEDQEKRDSGSLSAGEAKSSPANAQTIELVLKRLDRLERENQSQKDKGIVKLSNELAKTREQVEWIKKMLEKGLDEDEIVEKMAIKDLLRERSNNSEAEVGQSQKMIPKETAPVVDREAIARKLGIDVKSAEYIEIAGNEDDTEFLTQLTDLVSSRKQSPMQPNPGAYMPTSPMGGALPKATPEQYINEMMAARGKGYDMARQIKEKYRKAGVDVDNIRLV